MILIKKILASIKKGTFFKKSYNYIKKRLFIFLVRKLPIDDKKIIFNNFFGQGYSCNPKYIAEKIHETHPEYKLVWAVEKNKIDTVQLPPYIKITEKFSHDYYKELCSSKFWIDNVRKYDSNYKRKKQLYIQTWHGGIGPKKIEADCEKNLTANYIKNAKQDSQNIDLCVSSGTHLTNIYKNSFWYSGEVLECGSPRNDILFQGNQNFYKEKIGFSKDSKICLYAPTFRKDHNTECYNLDYEMVKKAMEKKFGGEWNLIVRLHPNIARKSITIPENVKNFSSYPDVQELLAAVDCVITDYSSIIYDFMLTSRPAFIYASDYIDYTQNDRDLYFTLDSTPFSVSQSNEELFDNISNFDMERYIPKTEEFLNLHGVKENGTASQAVVDWIVSRT